MTQHPPHPQRCRFLKASTDGDFYGLTCYAHGIGDCRKSDNRLYVDLDCFGCASHTTPASQQRIEQKFNSTELLLLANDEWKRREERKHNHENAPWVSGFVNGFCTDKKWAREYVDALLREGDKS